MKSIIRLFAILFLFLNTPQILLADVPYFLDFKYILNNSDAGKKAQDQLKKKLENGIKSINNKQKKFKKKKKIIEQKK